MKKAPLSIGEDNQPKVVKTARVNENLWNAADELCNEQHGCGVSSIVNALIASYFGLDTKNPPAEWKKRFPLLFPRQV